MLSDISITRPVFATVLALLLIAFGVVGFQRLPLREYPDIDPPVVSIRTNYPGASAQVVESRITQIVEDRVAGLEGIRYIESRSEDGQSTVTIEFNVGRDIDGAANDVRDRVSGILDNLPVEADPPDIQKVDADEDVILWLNFQSDRHTLGELTDFADRYLVDRFSVLDGVARVQLGGGQEYAMRVWLDRRELAARGLAVADVERALRSENVELPAGSVESLGRQFTVRVRRNFQNAEDFRTLVLGQGRDGHLVRLGDVARIERGTREDRSLFRGNGVPMIGLGIVKQSTANTIAVARAAKEAATQVNPTLPEGMVIGYSYDTSVFIEAAVDEVYSTMAIAIGLVVLIIFLFIGNFRATLVPAVTVPTSIVGTFLILYWFGFTLNLLTLLGLVLSIGLVVDDAIVVLENISRRIHELGESPLVAAYYGTRQVQFAVIATTVVLIAVFVPIAFLEGDLGRLFSEFALTLAAAVGLSSFVALSFSPMLASVLLRPASGDTRLSRAVEGALRGGRKLYGAGLRPALRHPVYTLAVLLATGLLTAWIYRRIPAEYTPAEDRGAFFIQVTGPEGASFEYTKQYLDEIERRLQPFLDSGEVTRLLIRAPRGFGRAATFNGGFVICVLDEWNSRRDIWTVMREVRGLLADLTGVRAVPLTRQGFGARVSRPVQFVVGGPSYEQLAEWRDLLNARLEQDNPGLLGMEWDYKETKPQVQVVIDYDRAAELGVRVDQVGRTLETLLGSRQITTYLDQGQEYDVILEGERETQRTPSSLEHIYVRAERTGELIPLASLVRWEERADAGSLNRYNRIRAITLEATLADGYALGDALDHLERVAREVLPAEAIIDYKGQSADFRRAGGSIFFLFLLGLTVVFLVLAAQFESFIHPLVIMLTVPLAVAGGMVGLWATGSTMNIFSQVGLIMLVGLAAKNGILIVEFANQLRDAGATIDRAIEEASLLRLRPILMTAITTVAGAVPLVMTTGAGAEARQDLGVVVIFGVTLATFLTLFVVPTAYRLVAGFTQPPGTVQRRLEEQSRATPAAPGRPA